MNLCLLSNPNAGSAGQLAALRAALERRHRVTVVETADGDDLKKRAAEAARGGRFDAVAVAGGDGTVHAVVNALGPDFPRTPLAVLPLGTGNDWCRTLSIPLDPAEAARSLRRRRVRAVDVARVEGAPTGFLVNAATGGFSGLVAAEVTSELKQAWGPLAYLRGAAGPIADWSTHALTLRLDGGPAETFAALNVVVANGRTAAGGLVVAPKANPEDGLLDVVIVRAGDRLDLSVVAARLMAGDYLGDENVVHRRARRVELESDPPMPFSLDGEKIEAGRLVFTVLPKALRVIAGPGYRPNPARPRGAKQWLFAVAAGGLWAVSRAARWPGLGLLTAAVALLGFGVLARGAVAGSWVDFNAAVAGFMAHHRTPGLSRVAEAVTRLGDPKTAGWLFPAAACAFVVRRRFRAGVGVLAVAVGLTVLEEILKPYFAIPRPAAAGRLVEAVGYGFPSGHALRGVGFGAFVGGAVVRGGPRVAWRWAAGLAAGAAGLAVAGSRVYLGVHSAADVLAGGLLAVSWAGVCLVATHPRGKHQIRSPKSETSPKPEYLNPKPDRPAGSGR